VSRAERETARVSGLALTFFDAFNRGGTDAADQYLAPDVIFYSAPGWAGDPVYEGIPGARALAREWTDHFDDYQWVPSESHEVDERRAVLLANHSGRTRAGVPIEGKVAALFTVDPEADKITEIRFFFSWEEALEAAGIER
jgi:ketosteroid isomerase-like protein